MYDLIPAVRVPPPVSVSHLVVRVLGPAEEEFQTGYMKAPSHPHPPGQAEGGHDGGAVEQRGEQERRHDVEIVHLVAARWRVRSSAV